MGELTSAGKEEAGTWGGTFYQLHRLYCQTCVCLFALPIRVGGQRRHTLLLGISSKQTFLLGEVLHFLPSSSHWGDREQGVMGEGEGGQGRQAWAFGRHAHLISSLHLFLIISISNF